MVNRIKKLGRVTTGISDAAKTLLGKNLSRAISGAATNQVDMVGSMPMYKKGGRVRKTGPAIVHKGEIILTAATAKRLKKILKK
jgi:hypothetical protein